jgi:predicted nucleic acid-binding protein
VVTHPRVLRSPFEAAGALSFVEAVLASSSVHILTETSHHLNVLAEVIDDVALLSGNLFHDAHTAALMREHGIRSIVTRDTDFHRFRFLEVLDPLQ